MLRKSANNSVSIFTQDNRQLDFLIDACLRIASAHDAMPKLAFGAHFVAGLAQIMPAPLLLSVGVFSPILIRDIASGADRFVPRYASQLPARLAAVNLCNSLVGQNIDGFTAGESDYRAAVERCLVSRGEVVNRYVPTPAGRT